MKSGRRPLDIKADIDLSAYSLGTGWLPIGMEVSDTITGLRVLGNGHTITGMTVNQKHNRIYVGGIFQPSNDANYGLFGRLKNSEINNLHIRDAKFTGGRASRIGALAAFGESLTVYNCSAQSVVNEESDNTGGLVGSMTNKCSLRFVSADLTFDVGDSYGRTVGGILGKWERIGGSGFTMSDAYSNLRIRAKGVTAGGMVRRMRLHPCFPTATATSMF